jgi:thiosulfate/3-mercaptopyruvate sulfurtransferase
MAYTTLVGAEALASHLHDPSFCIVDCRFTLEDTAAGERWYQERHIPGAVYAHLDRDLSGPKTGTNGRHPLPDPGALARTFSRFGVDRSTQVVAYGAQTDMFAARLWWLLRWLGHDRVAVLDGGFDKWLAEKRPVASGIETRAPRGFEGAPRPGMVMTADEVAVAGTSPAWRVIDARAPERYRGDVEPIDAAAGHIPGAVNQPFRANISAEGCLLPAAELRSAFGATLGDVAPERVVCYCGSGVSACHDLLAMEHAGLSGAKLYAGSWSEWSSDPARPIETGDGSK